MNLPEFLRQTQFFLNLPNDEIAALAEIALLKQYQKEELIFEQGDAGNGFFIIVTGRVKVFKLSFDGKEQILHIFNSGEHFAEVPAFDGQCFPASAQALEPTELLFFPRTAFLNLLHHHPSLAVSLLTVCSRHLRRFAQIIENLSFKDVSERLATYLLYLSQRTGNLNTIELDLTKTQLAALLGTIPETLSRVFARLTQEGLISINGSSITILDHQELIKRAKISFFDEPISS